MSLQSSQAQKGYILSRKESNTIQNQFAYHDFLIRTEQFHHLRAHSCNARIDSVSSTISDDLDGNSLLTKYYVPPGRFPSLEVAWLMISASSNTSVETSSASRLLSCLRRSGDAFPSTRL